jgi:hypothetical protein
LGGELWSMGSPLQPVCNCQPSRITGRRFDQ